jgi:hypothetical protein
MTLSLVEVGLKVEGGLLSHVAQYRIPDNLELRYAGSERKSPMGKVLAWTRGLCDGNS